MVVCCGENLIDMVPLRNVPDAPYGCFRVAPGGSPFNSAIAASRLGAEVSYIGKLASDFLGDKLRECLERNGVRTELTVPCDKPVTLAFCERGEDGENRYAFYADASADRSLEEGDLPLRLPPESRFLLVGSISLVLEPGASAIRKLVERENGRVLVSFDPNVRPSLISDRKAYGRLFEWVCARSAIVKASLADLEWIYGDQAPDDLADRILSLGACAVFITEGDKGSAAYTRKAAARAEAVPVPVVDTIGAGDTFHAAILAALDRGVADRRTIEALTSGDLRDLLEFASEAAALNCTREGADPPTWREVAERFPADRVINTAFKETRC